KAELPWPQHRDPPLLWPILTGLSVLLHLGLLALALPLLLRIVRPTATEIDTVTVPVELLVLDDQALSPQPAPSTAAAQETTSAAQPADTPQDTSEGSAQLAPAPSSSETDTSETDTSEAETQNRSGDSSTDAPLDGNTPVPPSDRTQNSQPDSPSPTETPTPTETPAPSPGDTASRNEPTPAEVGETDSPINNNPSTDVPTLPSSEDRRITAPETAGGNQPNPDSEVFVKFDSLAQLTAATASDLPDTPPQFPSGSNQSRSIVLSSNQYTCPGSVPPTSQDFNIWVIIDRNGAIENAAILGKHPEGSGQTTAEDFAVCLVRESDFRFIPAQSGGAPLPTDLYYLSVTITPANP
ncbi:MAG: hypothetical protein AAF808_22065, partial [Cyanobacteria bacterium P01_D01_bin.2]